MPNERGKPAMSRDAAEAIGIAGLGFLASDAEELQRFLNLSGLEPHQLRQAATEQGFLGGVLDYLAGHDGTLDAFQTATGHEPAVVMAARTALSPPSEDSGFA